MVRASLRGAGRGASTLSPRPFQGVVEALQNADDLGARSLHVVYRSVPEPELLIVHDGAPVTLANVGAMLLPWLSTKDEDPEASGRFGIGQRTLASLGGPLKLHASPFHFVMGDEGPEPCEPEAGIPGVYDPGQRHTLLTIRLSPKVKVAAVADAVRELGVDSLIFLKSIRTLSFRHLDAPEQDLDFKVEVTAAGSGKMVFDGDVATVDISEVTAILPVDTAALTRYRRYATRRRVQPGETRANKATGPDTPLGVCVPLAVSPALRLYDRMPLPIRTRLSIGFNAQFDPDSARSELQPNDWNRSRFEDLGRLTAWAALHSFAQADAASWKHIPLRSEVEDGGGWAEEQLRSLVEACHTELSDTLRLETRLGPTAIENIAYEAQDLESLIEDAEVERLRPDKAGLPRQGRDSEGRWRLVLDELGRSDVVSVEEALEILDGEVDREAGWYVAFAALAERHGLTPIFTSRPAILLEDGSVTARPQPHDPWVLVRESSLDALAKRLGLVRRIHPAYLQEGAGSEAFLLRLEKLGALHDHRDTGEDVFAILGRGLATGRPDMSAPVRVQDADLIALRAAWAQLPRDRHIALGPRIGRAIELKAYWYGLDGKTHSGWARPVEAYLPTAIDREVDSFAKAAGRAAGLKWLDSDYARLLKQPAGRTAIGAQRLLAAWGAAREPRLVKPDDERPRWARDTTPASAVGSMQTGEQLRALRSGGYGYIIDDHWSPDADIVAADIAKAPVKVRRKRAVALLATLGRGWERRYSDAATASPANAYNGYWRRGAEIRATWLARLADVRWMPDAANGLQRPADLQLQAPGQAPRPSERSATVARFDSQILRSGLLAALGVKSGPTQRDLVAKLQALRDQPHTAAVTEEASAIYQLLAASLRDRGDQLPEGRMTSQQLRNAFRAAVNGRGLLLVDGAWHAPEQVLGGPALFGTRRAFAPHVDGLEPLWRLLGVRSPVASDAIAVLKEMAVAPPSAADLGVAIRAYALIAGEVGQMSSQLRTTLKRLPLWTGAAWTTSRPIYAFEGEALLSSAPPELTVWRPDMTSFTVIAPLLEPLGVLRLTSADFEPETTPAYGLSEGEAVRPTFAAAVSLLRQELVRADQALLDSLSLDWDDLISAPLVIDPALTIVATLTSGKVVLPARAHMGREPLRLIARSAADIATADGGGAAVASLFEGDRQKAAWAWASIWPRAAAGEMAEGAILPRTRAGRGDAQDRLQRLGRQAAQRKTPESKSKGAPPPKPAAKPYVQVRKLRELDDLEPSLGEIVNPGAKPSGGMVFAKRRANKPRVFTPGRTTPDAPGAGSTRTVLPPANDREAMALDAVRRALRLDVEQLNDLRASRGVGVDAIDELRQCYEIKMSASDGVPTDVNLTASEIDAARNDEDFFLAIVSGLEDGAGQLRVRFIFDPLTNLDVRVRGDVTLTGVDKAEALEFRFDRRKEPSAE